MKKLFDLQLFADDAASVTTDPVEPATAEGNENGAAADQDKGKANEPKDEKKYSDKDLDEIINKKFAKWEDKKQREMDEAKKLAAMNATQKAEYERDQLKAENEELKREKALAAMTKTARKMLSDEGISASDELLSLLVTTDAEKTKASVDSFTKLFKAEVENAVQEKLKGKVPTVSTGNVTPMSEIDKRIAKYT